MLKKNERLKDRYLFSLAFKKKLRFSSKRLNLYYLFRRSALLKSDKQSIKTAFIVGVKVDKRATKRNLIKRRMKAAYKLLSKDISPICKNKLLALIWIANENSKESSFEEIKKDMRSLVLKLDKLVVERV